MRATKPAVVVETGVDKGLGSCLLSAALTRNSEDEHPGYFYGTDINPKVGYLLQAEPLTSLAKCFMATLSNRWRS